MAALVVNRGQASAKSATAPHTLKYAFKSASGSQEMTVSAAPSQHFSGRGIHDGNRTLWSSWVIESQRHKVFFSGDTGLTPEYAEIRQRLGPFDLTMLEIGAFHPAWGNIHLGPANALTAHGLLGGGALLPILKSLDPQRASLVRQAFQQLSILHSERVSLTMPIFMVHQAASDAPAFAFTSASTKK